MVFNIFCSKPSFRNVFLHAKYLKKNKYGTELTVVLAEHSNCDFCRREIRAVRTNMASTDETASDDDKGIG